MNDRDDWPFEELTEEEAASGTSTARRSGSSPFGGPDGERRPAIFVSRREETADEEEDPEAV